MNLFAPEEVERVALSQDCWQTPPQAVLPLTRVFPPEMRVWEPCAGKGSLVRGLCGLEYEVIASDIEPLCEGVSKHDFFEWQPSEWDCIVTNPPYSILDEVIARCYELRKPFALLVKIDALGGKRRQEMYRANGGISVIMLGGRLEFETPTGKIEGSSPNFETCWIIGGCWGDYNGEPFGKVTFTTLPSYRHEEALRA